MTHRVTIVTQCHNCDKSGNPSIAGNVATNLDFLLDSVKVTNSVYNINTRHAFLTRLSGTKPEEDTSLEAVNRLTTVVTVTTVVAWGLEVAFYFIYNRFVSKILEF